MSLARFQMGKQPNSTACWVTVSQFCMRCLGTEGVGSLDGLVKTFQKVPEGSQSAMAGAGRPATVLDSFSVAHRRQVVPKGTTEIKKLADEVAAHVMADKPVIINLVSPNIGGFAHANVIVSATSTGPSFGIKDPALPNPNHIRFVTWSSLFEEGYLYTYHQGMGKEIYVYCKSVIFVG